MKNISVETIEVLNKFNINIRLKPPIVICYILVIALLKKIFFIPLPNIIFSLLFIMLISSLPFSFYFKKFTPNVKTIINLLFLYMFFNIFLITLVIYFLGGISWIGFIFYSFFLLASFTIFPRHYAILLTFLILLLFLGTSFFQYLNFLPTQHLIPLKDQTYFNFSYVLITTIAFITTIFFVAYFSRGFYQMYIAKIKDLRKIESVLEGEKAALKIRVRAKRRELIEGKEKLEERIKTRAKELEKESRELEERAEELAKFQKVAIGRELKMKKLKEELVQLKIELKS